MSNPKFKEGERVKARFMTYTKNTGKESIPKSVIEDGVVVFDEEEQKYYVESEKELPCVRFEDNGRMSRYRSWLVQDYEKLRTEIKNIIS